MKNNRKHTRIKLKSKCVLVDNAGDTHPAALDDLSLGGALVEIHNDAELCVGDECELLLSLNTAEHPLKRSGKIVRQSSKKVGLTFTK